MCDHVRGIRLCETLLEFPVNVFEAMMGKCISCENRDSFDHSGTSDVAERELKKSIFLIFSNIIMFSN